MIKILLADDHKIVRHAMKMIIADKPDLHVVGEADNAKSLMSQLANQEIHLIILDINLPDKDGFDLVKTIKSTYPQKNIMVFSMFENESLIRQIIEIGALGYILKSTETDEIIHAIRTIGNGSFYICMNIAEKLLKRVPATAYKTQRQISDDKNSSLSKRELEVLSLIAEGLTNAEIAERLFTSKRTIDTHRQNLIEKTNTRNTATLIKFAISNGLVQ